MADQREEVGAVEESTHPLLGTESFDVFPEGQVRITDSRGV